MITSGTALDPEYVEAQLIGFRGPTFYPSAARFRALRERLLRDRANSTGRGGDNSERT